VKHLLAAVEKAAQDTAHYMQREIRNSAREHGWDDKVVHNTHVDYKDGEFNVNVPKKYANQAFVHEFGSSATRPTAVIRKYENNNTAGAAFTKSLNRHLRGK
jgi:hypothetical protein